MRSAIARVRADSRSVSALVDGQGPLQRERVMGVVEVRPGPILAGLALVAPELDLRVADGPVEPQELILPMTLPDLAGQPVRPRL